MLSVWQTTISKYQKNSCVLKFDLSNGRKPPSGGLGLSNIFFLKGNSLRRYLHLLPMNKNLPYNRHREV